MASTRLKTKKDGTRYYEISVRPSHDKTVCRRWYPPDGWSKRAVERELQKKAAEIERQVKEGAILSRRDAKEEAAKEAAERAKILTVRQYAELVYMPALTLRSTEHTRSNYQTMLDRWILPALGDFKLPDVSAAQITALLLSMQEQGKAHSTVVKAYTILQGLFKDAFLAESIQRNPMDRVQRPKPRKDEKKTDGVEAYTAEEVRTILEALDAEPLKWRVYVSLLIDTGMRRGEATALEWKDVDFRGQTITVSKTACYTPAKGVYTNSPKNGHTRVVPIGADMVQLLRELRDEQAASCVSAFIFTQDGLPDRMHPDSPTRWIARFAKRCGVAGLHPHALRHSFASLAITNGADVASVAEVLGHSDKAVTLRVYAHASEASKRRASEIFHAALWGKDTPPAALYAEEK